MPEVPSSAAVVVVGGGVTGTSTLFHLARAGCTDAVLVERETLGAGSTAKAAGGIRAQFSDETNIRMALENIRRYRRFGEEVGGDIDFKQWGYLFLLRAEHVAGFRNAVALQQQLGVPSEILEPEAALAIVPQLDLNGIAAATYCPVDGYATPEAVVQGYAAAATARGARIVQGVTVLGIETTGGKVRGVTTSAGAISTETVVCAAGVWSVDLATTVGVELPVTPERRHVWLTAAPDPLPRELPLTIDFDSSFYFQREGDRILFGGRQQAIEDLAPAAAARLPVLEELPVRHGWWGYYAMTPDHNAVIGSSSDPAGFLYATGFSGHGFQQAPVVGEYLADLALGRPPTFDLAGYSVTRFDGRDLRPERHVV